MAQDQLLLRGIPSEIRNWIAESSHHRRVSQNQFILDLLKHSQEQGDQLPLFSRPEIGNEAPVTLPFKFIDLFAGIGGMRLGLEAIGGECVFSSEWDKQAQRTYTEWFGDPPFGDITEPGLLEGVPSHDILAAGFPCQPFSIAGVSKKKSLGREHGFKDEKQGNLFFTIMECVDLHRPAVLLLENVKNLRSHDGGRTWTRIESEIVNRDYSLYWKVIDAAHWVPQHRERIFLVALDQRVFGKQSGFTFSESPAATHKLRDILEPSVPDRYTLSDALWEYLQRYAQSHREKGNGFGFGIAALDGITRTLSARYYKDGSEILIPQPNRNPRRLTPREAARLMGFPEHMPIVVSDTQAYKQFGNSVVPNVVASVGRDILRAFATELRQRNAGVLLPPRRIKGQRAA